MAGSLNKVVLIGNVGQDPEIRVTSEEKTIANFSLATSESWKDKTTGEQKEKTEWHRIVVFNEKLITKVVKPLVRKGSRLYIEGQIQTRRYVDSNGQERTIKEIILQFNSQLLLLDSRQGASQQIPETVAAGATAASATTSKSGNNNSNFDNSDLDDEIPF
ncbi:MAG: single-stranded DNA-binding protein [Rickettsiaceae bacterium]|nr:single-stranded DNA-binding protein [Rickettsiaceae bacterium]